MRASSRFRFATVLFAATVALAPAALAQEKKGEAFVPEVGQAGKDVVWVPTDQPLVDKMLDMARVTPQDYLIDLGSGDGRTVIAAAKRGLRAHGIEYNPKMVDLAKVQAARAGVADRATFEKADLFQSDFSQATVITMFLLEEINQQLRPKILDLKPGTRIVSNTFTMGDWVADEEGNLPGCSMWCTALLWIVPAKVQGTWRMGDQDLTLTQKYQMLTGKLGSAEISDGRMKGAEISFIAGGVRYVGTVSGNSMTGRRGSDAASSWTASRM